MAGNTIISIDTVGLGIAWQLGQTYRVSIDEGFVSQSGNSKMPIGGNSSIISFSTPNNPPQIGASNPTHTTTAPINIQDISFTIDRNLVTVLGGNVYLNRQGTPNVVVKTYVVSNANTTGNTVSFSVIGNLEASQTYFITSNANIFLDRDGFKNNAITNSSSFRFISPTAPTVTAFTPGNATVATANFTNVAIDFDRTIFSNSGNFYLHNANTNAVIRTYAISSGLISNNKIALDIVGNIDANGYYYVKSNANVVMDITQIKYPGITTNNTWLFQAPTNPFISSTSPAINANVSRTTTSISLTLDRKVTELAGNIYLYNRATPNVLLKTWTIGSNVSFDSDKTFSVTVPQGMLAPTQNYFVTTTANIARDLTYINYLGISSNTAYTFSTGEAPIISSTSPAYGQAADENLTNVSFTMDRLVSKNVGNLYLYKVDTVNGNSLVRTYDIVSNTYIISNQTINLPISNTLKVMETYYVTSDYDILKDYYNNEKFQGIINSNTFVFTTSVNRTYIADRPSLLFPDNIPQITETDLGDTYTITLQLSNAIGQIHLISDSFVSPANWNAGTNTYTFTGNKTAVNSNLSNLYFLPFAGVTSNATVTFTQSKNSIFQKSQTFTLSGSASPAYLDGGGETISLAEDSKFNFMPFYIYPSWNSNCAVMLKSMQGGTVAIAPGKFYANTATGWTNANDGVIYKSFSRPANLVVYNSQVAEVRDIYYWLSSDYTTSFTIDALLGIESTPSGNTLTGGTLYSVTNTYNINGSNEYSLTTSSTYIEDTVKQLTFEIIDVDQHPDITYNVSIRQVGPDPGLISGAFTTPGKSTKEYGSITDTQTKSAWTNAIYYYPPGDYTGGETSDIILDFTLTKLQTGKANVSLASNVSIFLTNSATDTEYNLTTSGVYNEDSLTEIVSTITDNNGLNDNYYINIRQISPDPVANVGNIIINGTDYGPNALILTSKSSYNGYYKSFYPPADYTGNIVFGYTQLKNNYNGNITQASNIAITYTNTGISGEYYLASNIRLLSQIDATSLNGNLSITDAAVNKSYSSTITIDNSLGNLILANVNYGNTITLTGTKNNINSNISSIILQPALTTYLTLYGNLYYTQTQTTNGLLQANNVSTLITLNTYPYYVIPDYVSNVSIPYADGFGYLYEDNNTPFYPNGENPEGNPRINDKLGLRFQSPVANATMSVTLTSTAPGRFLSFDGNVNYGNTITVSGNAEVISSNIANIRIMGNLISQGQASEFNYPIINLRQTVSSESDPTYGNLVANVYIPIALRKLTAGALQTRDRNFPDRYIDGRIAWDSWNTDYTWEARVGWEGDYGLSYPWNSNQYRCLWDSRPNGFALYAFNVSGNTTQNARGGAGLAYRMIVGAGTTIFTSNTLPFSGAFAPGHKIVIQRTISDSAVKCYINGNLEAQGTDANQYYSTNFRIGAFYDDTSNIHCWTGLVDEVRISSNIRYTNPTDSIFANGYNMGDSIYDIDANTKLLIGFNGADGLSLSNRYIREEVTGTYNITVSNIARSDGRITISGQY